MKKVIQTIQSIGQRAGQLQQAAEAAPERLQRLREAVSVSATQLRQLRSDIQTSVGSLKATGDADVAALLEELEAGVPILEQSGYLLDGLELEPGTVPRLTVTLVRAGTTRPDRIRQLRDREDIGRVLPALLDALLRATELADQVHLPPMSHHQVRVSLGPDPSVRIGWQRNGPESAPGEVPPPLRPPTIAHPAPPAAAGTPAQSGAASFGPDAFFAPRPDSPTRRTPPPPRAIPIRPRPSTPAPSESPAPDAEAADPLARFKRMPDLGRH